MRITFRFRWIPFFAAAATILVGIALGQWQMGRAAEKQAIENRLSARESAPELRLDAAAADVDALEYRQIRAHGEFVRDWVVYLENRPYHGVPGFYVLMPFKITGSDRHVLVERGWVARDLADRTRLPAIATPKGAIEITGRVRRNPGKLLQLGQAQAPRPGAIVQNLDLAEFAQAAGLSLHPFVIEQSSDAQDGLVRDWPRPSSGVDKHYGYAFQWYALAATAFIFFVVTGIRRGTN
jgi:surfeit locus 1 family protein